MIIAAPLDVTTTTHCPYCALQCAMQLSGTPTNATIAGESLCIKGWTSTATLAHPDRLLAPLARDASGRLVPVSWDEALHRVTAAFGDTTTRYGRNAIGVLGGGSLTNEKAYLLGKFARVALRTANIDYNGRFCMSSAAAAANKAFGIDRGLPFPIDDIAACEAALLVGGNIAETMPPLMQRFDAQRSAGGQLIVADPRRTSTGRASTLHLALVPGSDAALANGLLHVVIRDGLIDRDYISDRTEGFDRVRASVAGYWPQRVEQLTGVPESQIVLAARLLGEARTAMVLTARGPEQQARGVNNVLAYINLALALGLPGRPGSGYGALTGQGNGQGGREHGQKADQLPGYRRIDDPAARRHVAGVWGIDESEIPGPGRSAYELLDTLGQPDGVRALFVMGTNPAVSAPNGRHVSDRLRALDFLVVCDFFPSETAMLADVVLPTAQWAEEEGTTTNLEGRIIRRRRVFAPPPGVRTDLEIIRDLASRLGASALFPSAEPTTVFAELRRASAGGIADYGGVTYARIEAQDGVHWPCPDEDHAGSPRLFTKVFPTASGRARFHVVHEGTPAEEPDSEYPFYLTTGRVLAQYQSGTQTRRVTRLNQLAPEALAELHPNTARRQGINDGDEVALATRRGRSRFRVRLTTDIREDTIFVPFHWPGANELTNPTLDPTSRMPEFKVCAVRVEVS